MKRNTKLEADNEKLRKKLGKLERNLKMVANVGKGLEFSVIGMKSKPASTLVQ